MEALPMMSTGSDTFRRPPGAIPAPGTGQKGRAQAGEDGDDGGGELGEERVRRAHGVLLRQGASATPFSQQNASCALTALGAARAALGETRAQARGVVRGRVAR